MSFWALKIYSWVCVESLPMDLENEVAENRQGTHLSFVPSFFFFFFLGKNSERIKGHVCNSHYLVPLQPQMQSTHK
jgi:hypothetical protein